ncbi:hypothetical protein [uncultured Porphyromonas sp.]|uniref:hypothetical protein n=1 Tax=uncultured Porphyromonas sp. TaxID=159274 RepID=UPI002634AE03|nr:hypothetical protein [uncultured Porphyromonas sp.]
MNKKSIFLVSAALLLGLGLSSCWKHSDTPKLTFKRENLGSVKVNGKDFEHTVYLANVPYQRNPYLYYSEKYQMAYFPIYLSPKGSNQSTPNQYAIYLFLDISKGIPELNKPYQLKPNDLVNSLSAKEDLFDLFKRQKSRLLTDGSQGLAVVYSRNDKAINGITAEGSITFTSFDTKKGTCTATYQLKTTSKEKNGELTFTDGVINTKIYTDKPEKRK